VAGAALCLCACFYGLAGAGCRCVRLSVCLWCLRCACGAPCCAVCGALWSALIRCAVVLGCAFINKNKGLQRFLNEKDYMRFYLPINFSIISIMSLPLFDYIDNIMSIISCSANLQKDPPLKKFWGLFFCQG
jgi:hypothetical protein